MFPAASLSSYVKMFFLDLRPPLSHRPPPRTFPWPVIPAARKWDECRPRPPPSPSHRWLLSKSSPFCVAHSLSFWTPVE